MNVSMSKKKIHTQAAKAGIVYERRGSGVDNIMAKMPNWLIRRGTVLLCFLFGGFFVFACLIHYPDEVNTPVVITGLSPSFDIKSPLEGRMWKIFLKSGQLIKAGQPLCEIEDPLMRKQVVTSPEDGYAVCYDAFNEHRAIYTGEALLEIVPMTQAFQGKGRISLVLAGKIRVGQKVIISLAAWPAEEFGTLAGTVDGVYASPEDSIASLRINLSQGLRTSLGKTLPPLLVRDGIAQILMNDKSLMAKLFDKIIR
jgi:multidrug resistance efflux pump